MIHLGYEAENDPSILDKKSESSDEEALVKRLKAYP